MVYLSRSVPKLLGLTLNFSPFSVINDRKHILRFREFLHYMRAFNTGYPRNYSFQFSPTDYNLQVAPTSFVIVSEDKFVAEIVQSLVD